MRLRPYQPSDLQPLLALYSASVHSQCPGLYSPQQVEAWAAHASPTGPVAAAIQRGWTLVNPVADDDERMAAFGVLEPIDRLALLYCEGRWSRQGRASALLQALEQHARSEGVARMRTEASQLSRPLLLRHGWQIEAPETVLFGGAWFDRWRMIKVLKA